MQGTWNLFSRPISVRFTTDDGRRVPGYVLAWAIVYVNHKDAFREPEINFITYLMDDGNEIMAPKIIEWYA
jgi:hypothetical protein